MKVYNDIHDNVTLADYDRARQVFVSICAAAGISSEHVGFFGTVSHPGISDIDAVAIGTAHQLRTVQMGLKRETARWLTLEQLFWHPPVYVLESVIASVPFLHTLLNLDPNLRGVLEGSSTYPINPGARGVLNTVWYTMLLLGYTRLLIARRVPVRTILLLYKNFHITYEDLKLPANLRKADIPTSSELRRRILQGSEPEEALDSLGKLVEEVIQGRAKGRGAGYALLAPTKTRVRATRRIRILRGVETEVRTLGPLARITLDPESYEPIHRFRVGGRPGDSLEDYRQISARVAVEYADNGLDYPFVTPAGLGPPAV